MSTAQTPPTQGSGPQAAQAAPNTAAKPAAPSPALALAEKIHACRDCRCFWPRQPATSDTANAQALLPFGRFGPVPVYTAWPTGQANAHTTAAPTQVTLQAGAPSPALLKGCRQAPAMLVGINPNLKNFAAGVRRMPSPPKGGSVQHTLQDIDEGIRTIHPAGSDVRSYMAYHRHLDAQKVLMQIKTDDFEQCLDTAANRSWRVMATPSTTPATSPACLAVGGQRATADRRVTLAWRADGPVQAAPDLTAHVSWQDHENFVLLRRQAAADQTVAGYLTGPSLQGKTVSVVYSEDGFYTRLATLAQRMGGVPGEDVGLLDMAACASARWNETSGVDKDEVTTHCVKKHSFALAQLLQSRPQVLFFSGKEAWDMFCSALQAQAGGASPASYLQGLDHQVFGCNSDGLRDNRVIEPLGWLRQQAAPDLLPEATLRLQWPPANSSGAAATSDGAAQDAAQSDVWHCRLVPMAHFSYPNNVTELVHWPAQQHDDFLRDFPLIARLLKAGNRLIDPRQKPADEQVQAVFFGLLLLRPWVGKDEKNPALPLQQLCAAIAHHSFVEEHTTGAEKTDGPTLLSRVPSAQWAAAEQRIAPYKLDPLGLAARIAQQTLHAQWGWNLPQTQAPPAEPDKALGRWPRAATHCTYCDAAGLACDYRDAPAPTPAAGPHHP